jgi:hypothetical protein
MVLLTWWRRWTDRQRILDVATIATEADECRFDADGRPRASEGTFPTMWRILVLRPETWRMNDCPCRLPTLSRNMENERSQCFHNDRSVPKTGARHFLLLLLHHAVHFALLTCTRETRSLIVGLWCRQAFCSVHADKLGSFFPAPFPMQSTTSAMASPERTIPCVHVDLSMHLRSLFDVRDIQQDAKPHDWSSLFSKKQSRMKISVLSLFLSDFFLTATWFLSIRQSTQDGLRNAVVLLAPSSTLSSNV